MSHISIYYLCFKLLSSKSFIMNFLKNRYPFKLLTSIFRLATRTSDVAQCTIEPKRNKSDTGLSYLVKNSSRESVNLKKNSSVSVAECQNIEKRQSHHKLVAAESCNSLPFSKVSSEHSFKGSLCKKKTSMNLKSNEQRADLGKELRLKLKKLQASLEPSKEDQDECRTKLKRAYPWQNFNLNSISRTDMANKTSKAARLNNNLTKSPSDQSMATLSDSSLSLKSSNHSLRSYNSCTSLHKKSSYGSLEDIKNQMPLFKSILKKSSRKVQPMKEVTFNNITTIYGPNTTQSVVKQNKTLTGKKQGDGELLKMMKKKTNHDPSEVAMCLGRSEPLKQENSFLKLYSRKRQKTAQ